MENKNSFGMLIEKTDVNRNIASVKCSDVDVDVKRTISANEMVMFINKLCDIAFSKEDGSYCPEYVEIGLVVCTIMYYTNLDLSGYDTEDLYNYILASGLFDEVTKVIDHRQYIDLIENAWRKIKYACDSNIDKIKESMSSIEQSIDGIVKTFDGIMPSINPDELNSALSLIGKLGNISESDILSAITTNMSKSNRDEK